MVAQGAEELLIEEGLGELQCGGSLFEKATVTLVEGPCINR